MRIKTEEYNDEDKTEIDEVFIEGCDKVHIERLDDGFIWIAIYDGDDRVVVNLHTRRNALIKGNLDPTA